MWSHAFRAPLNSLALFQVYERFAPLTAFDGYTWRYQVDQPVSLQCYLAEGNPDESILHVRRHPSVKLRNPVFRVVGQVDTAEIDLALLEEWLEQGTLAWLRQLGAPLITGVFRYSLFGALNALDQRRYPKVMTALQQLPLVPLTNGEWVSFEQLAEYRTIYCVLGEPRPERLPGWWRGLPVVMATGQYTNFQKFLPAQVAVTAVEPETLRPTTKSGLQLRHLARMHNCILEADLPDEDGLVRMGPKSHANGQCEWRVHRLGIAFSTDLGPLFSHVPLSWQLHVYLDHDREVDESLVAQIRGIVLQNLNTLAERMRSSEEVYWLLCLGLEPRPGELHSTNGLPDWVWKHRYREHRRLRELLDDRANLHSFPETHPLRRLQILVRRARPARAR